MGYVARGPAGAFSLKSGPKSPNLGLNKAGGNVLLLLEQMAGEQEDKGGRGRGGARRIAHKSHLSCHMEWRRGEIKMKVKSCYD